MKSKRVQSVYGRDGVVLGRVPQRCPQPMKMDSHPGWGGKKPSAVALVSALRAVQQFIVENVIQPDGEPLGLPNTI